ncbi:uncharacterized protein ACB058_007138 [Synchiropus picturatus]
MGQNLEKQEEDQVPGEGSEETGPLENDAVEGRSSEEEAGGEEDNQGEGGTQGLARCHRQEPRTPTGEKQKKLREVRQGGVAEKEGPRGEGGSARLKAQQESGRNHKRGVRTEGKVQTSLKPARFEEHQALRIKMEYRVADPPLYEEDEEEEIPQEKYDHTDGNMNGNASVGVKMRKPGATTKTQGSKFSDSGATLDEDVNRDTESCAGTEDRLSKRKEPPTAKSQHPLINSPQKEALSDMRDTIHHRANKKEKRSEPKLASNDSSSTGKQAERTDEAEFTASEPASPVDTGSILERLLKRNKKEASPGPSKMRATEAVSEDDEEDSVERSPRRSPTHSAMLTDEAPCDKANQHEDTRGLPGRKKNSQLCRSQQSPVRSSNSDGDASESENPVSSSTKSALPLTPDQHDKKPNRESEEARSPASPKARPVSGLIKESIQLHEMLQHQDRSKPVETKTDDVAQSVKVAQMKAAFDVPKSPERSMERKPSVRKEKEMWSLVC